MLEKDVGVVVGGKMGGAKNFDVVLPMSESTDDDCEIQKQNLRLDPHRSGHP